MLIIKRGSFWKSKPAADILWLNSLLSQRKWDYTEGDDEQ